MVHMKKGELAAEEKELLEVIGKGAGAGPRPVRTQPAGGVAGPGAPCVARLAVGAGKKSLSLQPGTA